MKTKGIDMDNQKCEICGMTLTEQNRSKSYKHRCKPCVAKLTAERRAKAKESEVMSLDEAIKHCREIGKQCDDCGREHLQLAEWLTELKKYRKIFKIQK